jgi:hypothetical protein
MPGVSAFQKIRFGEIQRFDLEGRRCERFLFGEWTTKSKPLFVLR